MLRTALLQHHLRFWQELILLSQHDIFRARHSTWARQLCPPAEKWKLNQSNGKWEMASTHGSHCRAEAEGGGHGGRGARWVLAEKGGSSALSGPHPPVGQRGCHNGGVVMLPHPRRAANQAWLCCTGVDHPLSAHPKSRLLSPRTFCRKRIHCRQWLMRPPVHQGYQRKTRPMQQRQPAGATTECG